MLEQHGLDFSTVRIYAGQTGALFHLGSRERIEHTACVSKARLPELWDGKQVVRDVAEHGREVQAVVMPT